MKFGSVNIGGMSFGSTKIGGAKYGNTIVFKSGSPTPPGVVFYDRLVFDGTAYIETNYVLPVNCSILVNVGYESRRISQRVFRSQGGGGYILLSYGGSTSGTKRQLVVFYDSSSALASTQYVNFSYDSFSFFMTPNHYGVGNSAFSYTKGNSHPTGGIVFGDGIGGQAFTGRMSSFKVYDSTAANVTSASELENNYTPIATFRPCTYNGEVGLWYVEGNQFYGNTAGAGTLTVSNS